MLSWLASFHQSNLYGRNFQISLAHLIFFSALIHCISYICC